MGSSRDPGASKNTKLRFLDNPWPWLLFSSNKSFAHSKNCWEVEKQTRAVFNIRFCNIETFVGEGHILAFRQINLNSFSVSSQLLNAYFREKTWIGVHSTYIRFDPMFLFVLRGCKFELLWKQLKVSQEKLKWFAHDNFVEEQMQKSFANCFTFLKFFLLGSPCLQ